MQKFVTFSLVFLLFFSSCTLKKKEIIVYHKFEKCTWNRYDHLLFNIPVEETNKPYNIFFFARHSKDYEYDNLDIGVIMNTPSGEERINQYNFPIRKKFGGFTGQWNQDTCESSIALKRGISFSRKGVLNIDVENLVPRLEVKALFGAGIRLIPAE